MSETIKGRVPSGARLRVVPLAALLFTALLAGPARGEDEDAQGANTAQQLSNPLASLISVPFQSNFDFGGGRHDNAFRYLMNVQPVIPIPLDDGWNLIARTVVPTRYQSNVALKSQTGLGDAVQSFFFSPPTVDGWTYGFGPAVQVPTATNKAFGLRQYGVGPTAVVVKQEGPFLFGVLANHVWSVGGRPQNKELVDSTFIQPFVSYTLPTKTTFVLNTESTYDWSTKRWTVPINFFVNQLVKIGDQEVQFGIGPRYLADRPPGAQRWGLRFNITLVFPDKK